jgi:putative ABC transport system substrate-binding protein
MREVQSKSRWLLHLGVLAFVVSLLTVPLVAEAQPAGKVYRIGALAIAGPTDTPPPPVENWEGFLRGLRESGYIEGQNVAFELRSAGGRPERFTDLAADLVRLKVDVIFARGSEATRAAKNATKLSAIPIVAIDLESDPVAAGFIASLAKPGGNLTGTFLDLAELSGKHVQFLTEMVPTLSRIAVLGHPVVNAAQLRAVALAAATRGMHIQTLELRDRKDVDIAIAAAIEARAGALIVLSSPLSVLHRKQIADLALRHRLPAMYVYRPHIEAGGLMSYGPNLADMFRQCGVYVGRILRGAKPADLPIERPAKFELVINAKTAKALALTIPSSLLVRADQVIE